MCHILATTIIVVLAACITIATIVVISRRRGRSSKRSEQPSTNPIDNKSPNFEHFRPDFFLHYRNENASLFIAFSIGIFAVLRLFENENISWFEWSVYTTAYWTFQLLLGYAVMNWIFTTRIVDKLHREFNEKIDNSKPWNEIGRWTNKPIFIKRFYDTFWRNFEDTSLEWITLVLIFGGGALAFLLFLVVALPDQASFISENVPLLGHYITADCVISM